MDLWQSLSGMVSLEYVSADNTAVLTALQAQGITIEEVRYVDELTVRFRVGRRDMKAVFHYAEKRCGQCRVLKKDGLFWNIRSFAGRPVLLLGFSMLILLTLFLPTRILFYRIEGNVNVPNNRILELVSQNGIPFGAIRRDIRSEKVKNALLQALPELEWVGINTAGCVATISVRERQNTDAPIQSHGVSSMIAARDGVIREMTVISGSAAVKPGQAVKAGQVLISGYTDCGISLRAERAQGEVYAITERNLTSVIPESTLQRGAIRSENKKYALIFGKKRINFYKDSGNLDMDCVKIYETSYLTLPGGFQLPIAIVTERTILCETIQPTQAAWEGENGLQEFSLRYLRQQMVAGSILSKAEQISRSGGAFLLEGQYTCLEMIGRERNEEIIKP